MPDDNPSVLKKFFLVFTQDEKAPSEMPSIAKRASRIKAVIMVGLAEISTKMLIKQWLKQEENRIRKIIQQGIVPVSKTNQLIMLYGLFVITLQTLNSWVLREERNKLCYDQKIADLYNTMGGDENTVDKGNIHQALGSGDHADHIKSFYNLILKIPMFFIDVSFYLSILPPQILLAICIGSLCSYLVSNYYTAQKNKIRNFYLAQGLVIVKTMRLVLKS